MQRTELGDSVAEEKASSEQPAPAAVLALGIRLEIRDDVLQDVYCALLHGQCPCRSSFLVL